MHEKDLATLARALGPVVRRLIDEAMLPIVERLGSVEKRIGAELPALLELRRDLEKGIGDVVDGLPVQIERFVEAAISGEASTVCRLARTEIASFDKDTGGYCPTGVVVAVVEAEVKRQVEALPTPSGEPDFAAIRGIVSEEVSKAAAKVPTAEDVVALMPKVPTAEEVAALIPVPAPGKSVTIDDVRPLIADAVAALPLIPSAQEVAAFIPAPMPGRGADPEAIKTAVEEAVAALPKAPTAEEVAALVKTPSAEEIAALVPAPPTAEAVAALIPAPAPGKDANPALIADMVKEAVAAIPPIDIAPLRAVVDTAVDEMKNTCERFIAGLPAIPTAEEVAALVPRQDGKDADPETIKALVSEAVAALPPAEAGKDASPEAIGAAVERALATWERPKDGVSVTVEQLQPVIDTAVDKAVASRPAAKDGVGLAGAVIDRAGNLVITLTDGAQKDLGRVIGNDGEPGINGLGFEYLDVTDGGMTFVLRFARGDQVKEFTLSKPTLADCYRGVWRDGGHKAGEAVTWGGSLWIARRDTAVRPETKENDDWQLAVKRGRDGQDFRPTEPKAPATVKLS